MTTNTQPTEDRVLKCKLPSCKTRTLDVQVYSDEKGSMRFNLCSNCRKTPFGQKLVPFKDSDKAIKKSNDDKNEAAKNRAEAGAESQAARLGMCQYPNCKEEDCKLWVTKAPHPTTGLHKGRYCVKHKDILNSDNRVLPYRFGKVMEIVTKAVITMERFDYEACAHEQGVAPRAVRLMFRTAVLATGNDPELVKVDGGVIYLTKAVDPGVNDTTPDVPTPAPTAVTTEGGAA